MLLGAEGYALSNAQLAEIDMNTTLTDPTTYPPLSISAIIRRARNLKLFKDPIPEPSIKPVLTKLPSTEEEWQEAFPPRTKQDLNIRRTRARDLLDLYSKSELLVLVNLFRNLDYIHMMNLVYYVYIQGRPVISTMLRLDMLKSLDHYIRGANCLNQIVKKYNVSMDIRLIYAEMGNLTGYRQPPMPGFDIVEETRKLAEAGEPHGFGDWDKWFETAADEVMKGQTVNPVEWVDLETFIRRDMASTAGASSVGKVRWNSDEGKAKFKARKNFLLDIFTPEEIYALVVKNSGHQVANAFVKPEMGKLRIAVTGDLENYYLMSWLNYLAAHSYTTWAGNTLEESRIKQARRMEHMIRQLRKRFSLPFDYAGFDHQPTLTEIKILCGKYLRSALQNTPAMSREYVKHWLNICVDGFDHAVCVVFDEGQKHEFGVTGGVQSGIRLTSLLGNFWNQAMTKCVEMLLDMHPEVYIRGDDSSVITDNYLQALTFRLGYASINAKGHDAKYGIHYQQTEFLRIWYTSERVYGYPNRAIPSLTQRKPWTSEPWDGDAVTRTLFKTLDTIERRTGRKFPLIHKMIIRAWCRIRKLDKRYLDTPISLGGLGMLPWTGYIPSVKYPHIKARLIGRFETRHGTWIRYQKDFETALNQTQLPGEPYWLQLQQEEMFKKAASDDIPQINHQLRNLFSEELKKMPKVEWTLHVFNPSIVNDAVVGIRPLKALSTVDELEMVTVHDYKWFGSALKTQPIWDMLTILDRDKQVNKWTEIDKYDPIFNTQVKQLTSRGLHKTAAIDWLFGKMEQPTSSPVHDQLAYIITQTAAYQIERKIMHTKVKRYDWHALVDFTVKEARLMLSTAAVTHKLYLY